MEKESIKGKRRARRLVLQALYQWLMSGQEIPEIEAQFCAVNNMGKIDHGYFCRLLHGISNEVDDVEAAFIPFLDRSVQELNPIELTVLRLSTFELLYCPEIPYRVVLQEAVCLTKEFGSQDGYRYVNGVLNNMARTVRAVEIRLDNE